MKSLATTTFLLLFLTASLGLQAQFNWQKTYPSTPAQQARHISPTPNGYLVMEGIQDNWRRTRLIWTDHNGDTLQTRTFGDSLTQFLTYDLHPAADGSYLMTGDYQRFETSPSMDSYVQKVDSAGQGTWFNKFGWPRTDGGYKDHGNLVKELVDGTVVVEGHTKDIYDSLGGYRTFGWWNSYLATFDGATGTTLALSSIHQRLQFNDLGQQMAAFDIETIGNRIFWLGAYFDAAAVPYSTYRDTLLAVFDRQLDTLFTMRSGLENYHQLAKSQDGNLMLFGQGHLAKMDTLGSFLWQSPNSSPAFPHELISDGADGYLAVASQAHIPKSRDFLSVQSFSNPMRVLGFDSSGTLQNEWIHFPNGVGLAYDITTGNNGGVVLAGYSGNDGWVAEIDSLGVYVVGLEEVERAKTRIYPNPTSGRLKVQSEWKIQVVEVFDVQGKMVWREKPGAEEFEMELGEFQAGMYTLRMLDGAGKWSWERIIIER